MFKYTFRIGLTVIGFIGGIWGAIIGFVTGFFIDVMLLTKRQEKNITNSIDNPTNQVNESEPFPGALFVCALVTETIKNPKIASTHIKSIFPEYKDNDWESLCRAAVKADSINSDFITECLAAKLKKISNEKLTQKVFTVLEVVEYAWNEELGTKPSEYLSQLLCYQKTNDELVTAYNVLGLSQNASVKEIKAAHRKLAILYHPDMASKKKAQSNNEFVRIQKAYDIIMKEKDVK